MTRSLTARLRLTADSKGFVGEVRLSKQELDKLAGTTRKSGQAATRAATATHRHAQSLAGAHSQALKYGAALVALNRGYAALRSVFEKTVRQEQAFAQVEARIRSTGGAAGLTAREIAQIASALQDVTTHGDEAILEMQALLLSFRNIGHEVFARTTEAVLDLAQGTNTDLRSAAIQLGKALDDPIRGLDGLSRGGTTFTEVQKDLIKSLAETNRVAEAQGLVLAYFVEKLCADSRLFVVIIAIFWR